MRWLRGPLRTGAVAILAAAALAEPATPRRPQPSAGDEEAEIPAEERTARAA